jgi:2-polyprenyl-3-methyl-5-hydroxy-6-metoxy-1,4-benzoquinol methylase
MNEIAPQESSPDSILSIVREYWNRHIHDWKVARSEPGSKSFFEEIEAYRFEKLHYLPRLVNFAGYAGKDVLDVGCGVGNDLSRFARGGARVTGVDLAEHSIELAKKNFAQRGLEGRFLVMDGERMILPNASFDLVYCHTVLHFTPNPRRMVEEIHRVLRPGGQGIIMTVNRRSWLNLMHRLFKVKIDHLDAPVFSQFTIAEFRRLLDIFETVDLAVERFPVATKVHEGMKARLFNGLFVAAFNALPRSWVNQSGHHLLAFVSKQGQGSGAA